MYIYLVMFSQYKNCLRIVGTVNTLMKQENNKRVTITREGNDVFLL